MFSRVARSRSLRDTECAAAVSQLRQCKCCEHEYSRGELEIDWIQSRAKSERHHQSEKNCSRGNRNDGDSKPSSIKEQCFAEYHGCHARDECADSHGDVRKSLLLCHQCAGERNESVRHRESKLDHSPTIDSLSGDHCRIVANC